MPILSFFTYKDGIELLFFCVVTYYFLRWLKTDNQSEMLLYFYGYSLTAFAAHYTGLYMISQLLFLAAPLVICIHVVLHQKTLQKNFVSLKRIEPATTSPQHWIEELIRTTLAAMHKGKSIIWVIERKEHLEHFLHTSALLYAELKKDLIDLLIESDESQELLLWINQSGKLIALQAQWSCKLEDWKAYGLLVSSKTDALLIRGCARGRNCAIIGQAKLVEGLSAHQLSLILHKLFIQKTTFTEGIQYAPQASRTPADQRHH